MDTLTRFISPALGLVWLVAISAVMTGCGPSSGASATNSKSLMPADEHLKSHYLQSCYGCHSSGAGGAPRTGNTQDWNARQQQGFDKLLKHAVQGYNNMPAKGMCMDCSEDDLAALVKFMVQPIEPQH